MIKNGKDFIFVKYFHNKYGAEEGEVLDNVRILVQNIPCMRAVIPNMVFLGLIKWK